jgi:superfamily I DNA/RNA helicase
VVGDEDQTIYGFTGASSEYLRAFARTHPGTTVVELTDNYRSSPEVLGLANLLLASTGRTKRLTATRPSGPRPSAAAYADAESELRGLASGIRARSGWSRGGGDRGPRPDERPAATIEAALTTAGIPTPSVAAASRAD